MVSLDAANNASLLDLIVLPEVALSISRAKGGNGDGGGNEDSEDGGGKLHFESRAKDKMN